MKLHLINGRYVFRRGKGSRSEQSQDFDGVAVAMSTKKRGKLRGSAMAVEEHDVDWKTFDRAANAVLKRHGAESKRWVSRGKGAR